VYVDDGQPGQAEATNPWRLEHIRYEWFVDLYEVARLNFAMYLLILARLAVCNRLVMSETMYYHDNHLCLDHRSRG
jgi:hypothetical protein